MTKINDGGPAFPFAFGQPAGMSRRDWFAGQALAGLTAGYAGRNRGLPYPRDLADEAIRISNAMLTALRSGGQDDE